MILSISKLLIAVLDVLFHCIENNVNSVLSFAVVYLFQGCTSAGSSPPIEMTLMEFFGCSFIAFGPPLALFLFTICRDSLRIIVLIAR